VPDPGSGELPPHTADKILTLLKWAKGLVTAAAVGGGLFIGGRMVLAHRRGDDTNVGALGFWLGACVLIGAAPWIVSALVG
jgi:hypothetical protein